MKVDSFKILYLHSSSDLFGSDRSLLRTIAGLDRRIFTPIACLPYNGPLVSELSAIGCEVYVVPMAIMRRSLFTPWGILVFTYRFLQGCFIIGRLAHRKQVSLIHSNTAAVLVGGIVSKMTGIKHVWHVREILIRPILVRKIVSSFLWWFADVVVGVSESVINHLAIDRPKIRNKSVVIHNGLDVDKFAYGNRDTVRATWNIAEDNVLVGMIGRVSHWKGQDLFLAMAQNVSKQSNGVSFVAVGSPFQGQEHRMIEFRDAVKKNGLEAKFIIEPFRSDIADILSAFDIFVLPSTLPDPFPTTVLEAMAAGRAIVGNGHGGVTEMIVHGESGFVVEPNNVAEMSGRVLQLVENGKLRIEFGASARARVTARFSVEAYSNKIAKLYETQLEH